MFGRPGHAEDKLSAVEPEITFCSQDSKYSTSTVKTLTIHHRIILVQLSHQPTIGLVWQDNGIKQGQSTRAIPCLESANPSEEVLSLNPAISGFTEMVNRKSFYGTELILIWYLAAPLSCPFCSLNVISMIFNLCNVLPFNSAAYN